MKPTTINGEEQKITALQLWNQILTEELQRIMMIENTTRVARAKKMTHFAEQFEVTKHRIIVDRVINELEAASTNVDILTDRLKATHWALIKRRRRLRTQIQSQLDQQAAMKRALLILVNTEPPEAPKR